MSRPARIAALCAPLLALAAVVAALRASGPPAAPAPSPAPAAAAPALGPAGEPPTRDVGRRSLRDALPTGALAVDADGHFVVDREALLFFESTLAILHEEPPEDAVRGLQGEIRDRLEPPAEAEALAFLDTFLGYREAAAAELGDPALARSADLERRLQWIRELRREHFGAVLAERLFGEEEDAIRVRLEARRVAADPDLDEGERRARLAALEERYPEPVRAARARASAPLRHGLEEQALRESGAEEGEIRALRALHFGPEAAERLAELDRERARFDARLAAYRGERDALLAGVSDPAERDARLAALRARHFAPEEVDRVVLLDRIDHRESAR